MRLALCILWAVAETVYAEELIDLHYYVRPPYVVKNSDTEASGLTADPAKAAFERAGVRFRWQQTPAKRQLVVIESVYLLPVVPGP